MKTFSLSIFVIILSALLIWHSIDFLSSISILLTHENGSVGLDKYTTAERFFALWPVSLLIGSFLALVIAFTTLFIFDSSGRSDVAVLKEKLKKDTENVETLRIQSLVDVNNSNERAKNAIEDARKQAKIELNNELSYLEKSRDELKRDQHKLSNMTADLLNKKLELKTILLENAELVEQYKRDTNLAKQKAKNHGNALNRKNNLLTKLKNDSEFLKDFINKNNDTIKFT